MPADSLVKTGLGNMEHKRFHFTPVEIKAVDKEKSTFEGFSAGIGNEDAGRDIIMPGAFAKSIAERVAGGRVKLLDQHSTGSTERLWGKVIEAEERDTSNAEKAQLAALLDVEVDEAPTARLWSKFLVSQKQAAQEALGDVADGILDGLSIGYRTVRVEFMADDDAEEDAELAWLFGKGTRLIHELAWWETSLVIWGMNAAALAIPSSVKSMLDRIAHLEDVSDTANEKEVRYAIRALHDLLGDEEEARMAVSREEYDALMAKVDRALEAVKVLGVSDENTEDLEDVANTITNTITPDGVDGTTTIYIDGFGEMLSDIKSTVESLVEDTEEEVEDDETKSEDPPEGDEDAGDIADETKDADGQPEDDGDHSDEHFTEQEEKEDEEGDIIEYDAVLARLRVLELSNRRD